ncbi:hypothetical protein ISCGN_000039 [Ixodes scapularis]
MPSSPNQEEACADPDADVHEFLKKYAEEKLPHQETLKVQAIQLTLTYVVSAGLSWVQVDGLLKLVNTLFGEVILPGSKYAFRKLWEIRKNKMVTLNFSCEVCHFYLGSSSSANTSFRCGECGKTYSSQVLIKNGCFFLTFDIKKKREHMLKDVGQVLGDNLSRLAASAQSACYSDITDGNLYKAMRDKLNMALYDITISFNSDGSPVFKSSKASVWPMQMAINELPVFLRWRHIIVSAIWFAKEHPPMHLFLRRFTSELNKVGTLVWEYGGQTVRSRVFALCCCVDSPARAAVLNRKQFNGYYGCSWCFQKGTLVEGTVKYPFEKDGESYSNRLRGAFTKEA